MNRILRILASVALAVLGLVLTTPKAQADPFGNVILQNLSVSASGFSICENLNGSTWSSCSPRGSLRAGENSRSKYGWKDTDGLLCGEGFRISIGGTGTGSGDWDCWGSGSSARFIKVGGCPTAPTTCTKLVRVYRG